MTHRYRWKNNEIRETFYGRLCRVVCKGNLGNLLLKFENGDLLVSGRYSIRKLEQPVMTEIIKSEKIYLEIGGNE